MTPTELTTQSPNWKSLSGKVLEGGYELKEIIEAEQGQATFRVRVLGDYSLKAAASFYFVSRTDGDDQLAIWSALRSVEDRANLSVPLGAGNLELEGVNIIYLVSQVPDEMLEEVLRGRALEPEEATEVLRSIAKGLQELHSHGFVHGTISPREVLALEDGIKLSTESVRRMNAEPIVERRSAKYLAPESGPRNLTGPSDVWCLGATLFEALTQKEYEPGLFEEAANLKHPFGALAACCLNPDPDKRCKLEELDGISRSKTPPAAKPKPVVVPPPPTVIEAIASAKPVSSAPIALVPQPTVVEPVLTKPPTVEKVAETAKLRNEPSAPPILPNELPLRRGNSRNEANLEREDKEGRFSGKKGWIYGVAAFLVIFLALWLLRGGRRPQPVSSNRAADSTTASTPANPSAKTPLNPPLNQAATTGTGKSKPGTVWPTKTLNPDSSTAAPSSPTPSKTAVVQTHTSATEGQGRAIWRVVMFTYNRQQDAEKKAGFVNGRHADLHAEVFSPGGSKSYLVVAGGRMTREEAARLRVQAIREGMPRDSYIQNYNH